jgi:hypothetical protein
VQDVIITPNQYYWMEKIVKEHKELQWIDVKISIRISINHNNENTGVVYLVFLKDNLKKQVYISATGKFFQFTGENHENRD